jgi:Archaeal/vacuolar-type H+-ATPase subunit I
MTLIFLAFVIGGIWISLATILSEKLGSKTGGMVANLPSTILVSLLFIGINQGATFAAQAASAVPIGMIIDTIFLFIFIALVEKGLILATIIALASWFTLAAISSPLKELSVWITSLAYLGIATTIFLLTEYRLNIHSLPKTGKAYSNMQLITRAIFAGLVVSGAVTIGRTGNSYWSGLFSTFPAVMLSSMVILTISAGSQFAKATGKVMLITSTNIVVYGWAVTIFYPSLGLFWGTILSYILAAISVYMLRPVVSRIR